MLTLLSVEHLPAEVAVDEIAEDAMQAAFALIHARLALAGYPASGDVSPDEAVRLDEAFQSYVRMAALNSPLIASYNEDRCTGTRYEDPENPGLPDGPLRHERKAPCPVHDAEAAPPVLRYDIVHTYTGETLGTFEATCEVDALAGYSIAEGFADPRDAAREEPDMDYFYWHAEENRVGMVITNYEVYARPRKGES